MGFVEEDADAFDLEFLVAFFPLIESKDIGKTGAATAFHTYAQAVSRGYALLLHDPSQLFHSASCQGNRGLGFYKYFRHGAKVMNH